MNRIGDLDVTAALPGRVLHVEADGSLYVGRGCRILRSSDSRDWRTVGVVPSALWERALARSRPLARLLRHEIRALLPLEDGRMLAATRRGIFHGGGPDAGPTLEPSQVSSSEGHAPPRSLARGPGGRILFGEYFGNRERRAVGIFASDDRGRTFELFHRLAPRSIRHIHGLSYDARERVYWIFAGDHESEPGIGRLSEDGTHFEWLARGEQRYRACAAFDLGDRLVYGTDSEKATNAVMSIDKATGRVERLQELEGSCLHACRFGGLYALSTTVEPSEVNRALAAALWVSRDGATWSKVLSLKKDGWNASYFQFGSIVLPSGESGEERIALSGQAIEKLDGLVALGVLTSPRERG